MARILCIVLLCSIWQCSDENNDPQSPTTDLPPIEGKECPLLALYAFEQHIQPAIDASCHACHGEDGEHTDKIELLKKENSDTATINRATMRSHRNKWLIDDGVLLGKIGDDDPASHREGGNQVAAGHITEEGITAWVAAEQKCSKGS